MTLVGAPLPASLLLGFKWCLDLYPKISFIWSHVALFIRQTMNPACVSITSEPPSWTVIPQRRRMVSYGGNDFFYPNEWEKLICQLSLLQGGCYIFASVFSWKWFHSVDDTDVRVMIEIVWRQLNKVTALGLLCPWNLDKFEFWLFV